MSKITAYSALSSAQYDDVVPIVDVHDTSMAASGTMKKITVGNLTATVFPSGDTSGITDAANITAAVAAMPAQGGAITLAPTAQWYIKCGNLVINRSGAYLNAAGCYINAVGTGDVIRMKDTSTYSSRTVYGGGVLGFPVIDGTSAGAGSTGLHIGDILQLQVDVAAQNFSGAGSWNVLFDNASFWTEQMRAHVYSQNGQVGFTVSGALTSTGSYDRCDVTIYVDQVTPSLDGVVFQSGANLSDGAFAMRGNFGGSASALTSAALRLTGTSPAGHPDAGAFSSIKQSRVDIGCECSAAANTPTTLIVGSVGNNVIGNCYGNIDFGLAGNNFTSGGSAVSSLYTFNGQVSGDSSLAGASGFAFGLQWNIPGGFAIGDFSNPAVTTTGGTITTSGKGTTKANPAGNITGVILQAGSNDGQQITVINESAFTITFAASGTSHVADGVSDQVLATTARLYTWDSHTNLWYRAA